LDAFLEVPWKKKFLTARAIEDYVAENENMNLLSIFKGQHIIIVSKEGDGTGWWKGKFYDSVSRVKCDRYVKQFIVTIGIIYYFVFTGRGQEGRILP
jgi:hypothetical protein